MTEETIITETIYGDLYLKFPDEASASEALYKPVVTTAVVYDDEGTPTVTEEVVEGEFIPKYDMSIDTIGIIYKIDSTDPENPVITPEEGWHVNTRGPITDNLKVFSVIPEFPRRVWA